jgi:hypothetical protein
MQMIICRSNSPKFIKQVNLESILASKFSGAGFSYRPGMAPFAFFFLCILEIFPLISQANEESTGIIRLRVLQ